MKAAKTILVPFRGLGGKVLALSAAGALVLATAFVAFHLKGRWPHRIPNQILTGASFVPLRGEGAIQGEALGVSVRHKALVLRSGLALAAADYPYLSLDIDPWPMEMEVYVAWRTLDRPWILQAFPVPWRDRFVRMSAYPAWRGTITDVGVMFKGKSTTLVHLQRLTFIPVSPASLLRGLWAEWTAFEGFHVRSINVVRGGVRRPLVSPVVAAAAWVGVTWLLYLALVGAGRMRWEPAFFPLVFLLGWVALDARWQWDLARQLQRTYDLFAGKPPGEKHLSEKDSALYAFIEKVKASLPETPQRIFLVTADPGGKDRYLRLRALYHLLPHNVYYYLAALPDPDMTRTGDYILILGRMPDVRYDEDRGMLLGDGKVLPAAPVLLAPLGRLYKVR